MNELSATIVFSGLRTYAVRGMLSLTASKPHFRAGKMTIPSCFRIFPSCALASGQNYFFPGRIKLNNPEVNNKNDSYGGR